MQAEQVWESRRAYGEQGFEGDRAGVAEEAPEVKVEGLRGPLGELDQLRHSGHRVGPNASQGLGCGDRHVEERVVEGLGQRRNGRPGYGAKVSQNLSRAPTDLNVLVLQRLSECVQSR